MTRFSPRSRSARGLAAFSVAGVLVAANGTAHAAATAVPLGTAATYTVLAGSGITNTGITTISGDVGSSPTSTESGFTACPAADCVTLTGTNHTSANPNDAQTQGAKADLTLAYNNAAGQTPSVVLTELAGQTLVAGVYTSLSGTFGMTGTLTLDGANNPSSVFIFQTATTLITAGTGNINLINGAQACNIFWQIGSAATLGAGSTLDGTVMAHDDISLGAGVTVNGRLLAGEQTSGAGAVTLINDTIIQSACAAPVTPPRASATPTTTPSASVSAASAASVSAASAAAGRVSVAGAAAARAAASKAAAQVPRAPAGGVHTGDGSTIPHASQIRPAIAVTVAITGITIASLGTTMSVLAHRRRRRPT